MLSLERPKSSRATHNLYLPKQLKLISSRAISSRLISSRGTYLIYDGLVGIICVFNGGRRGYGCGLGMLLSIARCGKFHCKILSSVNCGSAIDVGS